jgi:hypothetical protein
MILNMILYVSIYVNEAGVLFTLVKTTFILEELHFTNRAIMNFLINMRKIMVKFPACQVEVHIPTVYVP